MAVSWGGLLGSGQSRGSGGFYVTFQNVDYVRSVMAEIEDGLQKTESKNLRQAAKTIAAEVLIPALSTAAGSSGVPLAPAFADTARPKADRVVMVQVGGVNPKIRGFRAYKRAGSGKGRKSKQTVRDSTSRNYRTTLAWGSELGPFPGSKVNHYAAPRSSGHWVRPGTQKAIPEAKARYEAAIAEIIARSSRYR
jgi:hypothetical protein